LVGVILGGLFGVAEVVLTHFGRLSQTRLTLDLLVLAIAADALATGVGMAVVAALGAMAQRAVGRHVRAEQLTAAYLAIGLTAAVLVLTFQAGQRGWLPIDSSVLTSPSGATLALVLGAGALAAIYQASLMGLGLWHRKSRHINPIWLAGSVLLVLLLASAPAVSNDQAIGVRSGRGPVGSIRLDDGGAEQMERSTWRPNVVLITIDTLRADHLGAYGYSKIETPNLDALAQRGARFSLAITPQPQTNPAHATLFTGLRPTTHGSRVHMVEPLDERFVTLAEVLADEGYTTAGLFSWVSLLPAYSGLQQGFQTYEGYALDRSHLLLDERVQALGALYRRLSEFLILPSAVNAAFQVRGGIEEQFDGRADLTTAAVLRWLEANPPSPFFLWVHYYDPHYPYTPPAPFDNRYDPDYDGEFSGDMDTIRRILSGASLSARDKAHVVAQYDGEIAFVDQQVGRLLNALEARGLKDDTLFIIVGDHGESFDDHGHWFHNNVYQSAIHVPLLMTYPPRVPADTVVDTPVGLEDVFPTVLDILGLPLPARVDGQSLWPLILGEKAGSERAVFSQTPDDRSIAIITRDWKLILHTHTADIELYHLPTDPAEQHNRASQDPEVAARLEQRLRAWMTAVGIERSQ